MEEAVMLMAYLSAGWQNTARFILNWGWALGREKRKNRWAGAG